MDLTLNNEINKNTNQNREVESFMKELQNTLEKEKSQTPTLTTEFLNEIGLANKYKDKLNDIIVDNMKDLSYEYDFLYFDYDRDKNKYYFDLYSEGEIEREYLSKQDAEDMKSKEGTFWKVWDKDHVLEEEGLKDNIKFNTEYDLEDLGRK